MKTGSSEAATISAVIADDEAVARRGLRDMLGDVEWIRVVGEAANGHTAVQAIETLRPELVFLDVQMPGLLGTDVMRSITHRPFVVFTTAYAEHAASAFELGALDYLLKPFGGGRLGKALERVRAAIGEPLTGPSALDRLKEAFGAGPMTRLFVRSGSGVIPVPVSSIAWFEADGDYITAHGASRYMLHLSLARLESRLDARKFLRIHRTRIVNLDHVASFRAHGKGQLMATMKDGARLIVSRERAKAIRALGL
ncbi:MAG TPA: LytTR family DNA-binding domain-containing protein [Gemmatimonadaceae bacterium]